MTFWNTVQLFTIQSDHMAASNLRERKGVCNTCRLHGPSTNIDNPQSPIAIRTYLCRMQLNVFIHEDTAPEAMTKPELTTHNGRCLAMHKIKGDLAEGRMAGNLADGRMGQVIGS